MWIEPVSPELLSRLVVSNCLQPHGLQPTRFLCPWKIPGKDTGVGCHLLLQLGHPDYHWAIPTINVPPGKSKITLLSQGTLKYGKVHLEGIIL